MTIAAEAERPRDATADAGGAPKYRQKCDEVAAVGCDGFTLR
jgi:hypothetical protein